MADAVPVTLKDGAPVVEPEVDTVGSWDIVGAALVEAAAVSLGERVGEEDACADAVEAKDAVGNELADNTADTDGDGEAECEADGEKLVAALRLAACDGEVVAVPESDVVGDADASVVGDA